jgi:hypothetical protein
MSIETKSMHITPVGGNVFADLGIRYARREHLPNQDNHTADITSPHEDQ